MNAPRNTSKTKNARPRWLLHMPKSHRPCAIPRTSPTPRPSNAPFNRPSNGRHTSNMWPTTSSLGTATRGNPWAKVNSPSGQTAPLRAGSRRWTTSWVSRFSCTKTTSCKTRCAPVRSLCPIVMPSTTWSKGSWHCCFYGASGRVGTTVYCGLPSRFGRSTWLSTWAWASG